MGVAVPKSLATKLNLKYTLRVLLFTSAEKNNEALGVDTELDAEKQKQYKKYFTKKYPNHRLFWAGRLDVSKGSRNFLCWCQGQVDQKGLYGICRTERIAAGYQEGIMIFSYDLKPEAKGADP